MGVNNDIGNVQNQEMINGMSVRDAILSFMKFREQNEGDGGNTETKKEGPMWIECEFSRLKENEEQKR